MDLTNIVPTVPLADFKRTKIIATVGPSTDSYELILELIKAGANGLRLNFSHGTHESFDKQIKWIRDASKEFGKPVAIIQDLQGPKIRLGDFDGIVVVEAGQNLAFRYGADYAREGVFPIQYDLSTKVKRGERLYIYDGKVKTVVTSVKDGIVHVRAENDGILISRKGINLPDTDFGGDVLTTKDKKDIVFGAEHDIDFVAMSFVQTAGDISQLRRLLKNAGSQAKIIAKVETRVATENLEQIIDATDCTMVARGDLAVETEPEVVPIVQRKIVTLGLKYSKPSIIATQMLASMCDNPEPTRAEVSDIASAVLMATDAVMLSDETASGKYPIESVKMMKKIVRYTENSMLDNPRPEHTPYDFRTKQGAISSAVINLAEAVEAKAIVAETKSGATALKIAAYRPKLPIISVSSSVRVAQQLAIVYGTKNFVRKDEQKQAMHLTDWFHQKKLFKKGDIIVSASGMHPGVVGTTDTIKVRVLE
jgi:pyruvate kinase